MKPPQVGYPSMRVDPDAILVTIYHLFLVSRNHLVSDSKAKDVVDDDDDKDHV